MRQRDREREREKEKERERKRERDISIHTSSWSETSKLSLVVLDKTSPKRLHYKERWPSILLQEKISISKTMEENLKKFAIKLHENHIPSS